MGAFPPVNVLLPWFRKNRGASSVEEFSLSEAGAIKSISPSESISAETKEPSGEPMIAVWVAVGNAMQEVALLEFA
jgi:hypothetical protein